jgi:hypothetical protein
MIVTGMTPGLLALCVGLLDWTSGAVGVEFGWTKDLLLVM